MGTIKDTLGDRMKGYERAETSSKFLPLIPVYARIDGRCFSRFTKGFERPSDVRLRELMIETTKQMVHETNARVGYTQSDEISLAWLYEDIKSSMHFDGRKFKLTASFAADATSIFSRLLLKSGDQFLIDKWEESPRFDARVLQLPSIDEAAAMFIWREKDATKNALQMAARAFYSHKAVLGKNASQLNEMLFQKGVNFNDYPPEFKRGTYVQRRKEVRGLTAEELARIPEKNRPAPDTTYERRTIRQLDLPPYRNISNMGCVLFRGAEPILNPAPPSKGKK